MFQVPIVAMLPYNDLTIECASLNSTFSITLLFVEYLWVSITETLKWYKRRAFIPWYNVSYVILFYFIDNNAFTYFSAYRADKNDAQRLVLARIVLRTMLTDAQETFTLETGKNCPENWWLRELPRELVSTRSCDRGRCVVQSSSLGSLN